MDHLLSRETLIRFILNRGRSLIEQSLRESFKASALKEQKNKHNRHTHVGLSPFSLVEIQTKNPRDMRGFFVLVSFSRNRESSFHLPPSSGYHFALGLVVDIHRKMVLEDKRTVKEARGV